MSPRKSRDGQIGISGYGEFQMIGRGASSVVYRAWDEELSRNVAIKVLLEDSTDDPARKRFRREGTITANLGKHPHIVQVHATGFTDDDLPFVVMEYYEKGSIADRLAASGPFSLAETREIGMRIAEALEAAHRAGIVHRDVKPRNILMSEYGPALADFGIARSVTSLEWSSTLVQFTPMHAAPEILDGEVPTVQADIYGLGSTLYTMLNGKPPFAGPDGESLVRFHRRLLEQQMPELLRSDVPAEFEEVLSQALAKDPADRFRSAREMRDALEAVVPPSRAATSPWAPGGSAASAPAHDTPDKSDLRPLSARPSSNNAADAEQLSGVGTDESHAPGSDGLADGELGTLVHPDRVRTKGRPVPADRGPDRNRWVLAAVAAAAVVVVSGALIALATLGHARSDSPTSSTAALRRAPSGLTPVLSKPIERRGFVTLRWTDKGDPFYQEIYWVSSTRKVGHIQVAAGLTSVHLSVTPRQGYCFALKQLFTLSGTTEYAAAQRCILGLTASIATGGG